MSRRPTIAQLEALADFLEQNPEIAKGQLRTVAGKLETKRKWTSLACTLNSLGGANKDGTGWAKYWSEKKCALKKTCSMHASSMRHTGGGTAVSLPSLTALDMRMVAVMGGQGFAIGDSQLAVDPFPPMSSTTEHLGPSTSQRNEPGIQINPEPDLQEEILISVPLTTDIHPEVAGQSSENVPLTRNQSQPRTPHRSPRFRSRRLLRARPTSVMPEMERLTQIEEQRVNAETVTAQAFAAATERLDRCASALEMLAEATRHGATAVANALLEIAMRLPPPP